MKYIFLASCFLTAGCALQAQDYTARVNFGAKLEPQDVLMHGAGQSPDAFAAYWSKMPVGRRPVVYMDYVGLRGLTPDWADNLKAQLLSYPDVFIIPQIGLSLTDGVSSHYEQQVAAGDYDRQIDNLVEGLRRLATPVYLRIGYEFNGLSWNGYAPAPYKQAFIRIATKLRAADLEVATVWDAAVDGVKNYLDYYPGDDYVDWFGMNIFSANTFKDASLSGFFTEARTRKKPVMVGETTPRYVGAQGGASSWTGWYAGFFDFLRANPEVKQFNYIDWDWAYWSKVTGQDWANWGDARLETDAATYVRDLYAAQLSAPTLLHASSETAFRKRLGLNDSTAPPMVRGLSAAAAPGGVALTWTGVTDASGIARYYIYRDSIALNVSLTPGFLDRTATLGTASYTVAAMDRAGNLSARSDAAVVTVDRIERLSNGDFEAGLADWRFETFNAQAAGNVVADSTSPIAGSASARLTVSRATGTDWHLQLRQFFNMTQGRTYTVRFSARASAPVSLPLVIQQVASPNTIYLSRTAAVGTSASAVEYSFVAPASEAVAASFYFANIGATTVWVDAVSVEESDPGRASAPVINVGGVTSSASFLPGIVANSWLAIQGANLSPVAADTWEKAIVGGKLPTSLDGVSVRIGSQQAFVYFISPRQINVVAPDVGAGSVQVTVTTPAGASAPVTANVMAQAPAFFPWPGNQPVATRQDGSFAVKDGTFPGLTTAAARPGDVLILWGTGFGVTNPGVEIGVLVPADKQYNCSPVTVKIGATDAPVYGCALSPGLAGLYQVAIQVPASLADGDYSLKVAVNGTESPEGVILAVKK